jgi:hypothetical protein
MGDIPPRSVPGRPPDSAPCVQPAGPCLGNSVRPVLWRGCDLGRWSAALTPDFALRKPHFSWTHFGLTKQVHIRSRICEHDPPRSAPLEEPVNKAVAIGVICKSPECNTAISLGIITTDLFEWINGFGPNKTTCPVCHIEHLYSRENLRYAYLES